VVLSSMIMADFVKATAVQDACYLFLNKVRSSPKYTDKDTALNKKNAAAQMRNVSLALLANRFEMQKECLEKEIKAEVDALIEKPIKANDYDSKIALQKTSKRYDEKYPLLKMNRAQLSVTPDSFAIWSKKQQDELKTGTSVDVKFNPCETPLPSFCKEYRYPQTDTPQLVPTYMFPVPTNSTHAAIRLITLKNEFEMSKPKCEAVPQVCWPCEDCQGQKETWTANIGRRIVITKQDLEDYQDPHEQQDMGGHGMDLPDYDEGGYQPF